MREVMNASKDALPALMRTKRHNFVKDKIIRLIGSSEYLLVIDGIPKKTSRSSSNYITVRLERTNNGAPFIRFFSKSTVDGRRLETPIKDPDELLDEMTKTSLFGLSFKEWLNQKESRDEVLIKVSVNTKIKMLFIETSMYRLFKETVPKSDNLNILFKPVMDDGRTLSQYQLTQVLNRFRVEGFISMAEMERLGIESRISKRVPNFYRARRTHTLCMIRESNLFNPLFDDKMLYNQIKDKKLIKDILSRTNNYDPAGELTFSFLSTYEICKAMNIQENGKVVLVPMSLSILTQILAGFVMDADSVPASIPHRNKVVYVNTNPNNNLPRMITEKEYSALDINLKSDFIRSTAFTRYFQDNFGYFQSRGFSDPERLSRLMNGMTLL